MDMLEGSLLSMPQLDLESLNSVKESLCRRLVEPLLHSPVSPGHRPLDFVDRHRELQEDIVFQDIVTQLLVSRHLHRADRLGSSELVQLRKSFQETCGKYKLQDTQGEVKNLEAEMRELKVDGMEGDGHFQENCSEAKDFVAPSGRASATNMKDDRSEVLKGSSLLETKLQLGDVEFDNCIENGDCSSNSGKRRPSCRVAMSRLDVKRRRNDVVDVI